ncbi:MAG: hypothetical protein ACU85E_04135 [Gammaproteobacteria bacterium]
MKIRYLAQIASLLGALSVSNQAFAYTDEKTEEICKDPKIKGFNLPTYNATDKNEVPPEAELSFTVSGWTDPETIVVTAKNEPLDLSIENKMIFFRVKAKLPASLNGKFVRVNVRAKAVLGCKGETGWLLKVANADTAAKMADEVGEEKKELPASDKGNAEAESQKTVVQPVE